MNNLMTTDNREIFFNVQEKDLYSPDGDYAHDKKMLVREDTGSYMSVVNRKYRTVLNEEVLFPLQKQMVNHFDPVVLEDIQIKDHISKDGSVCFAEYILPKMKQTVETETGHKTDVGLRYILKNTFDGSSSVVFYGGVIDFFCTNGMIAGQYDVTRKRHTKNFSVDGFIHAFDDTIKRHHTIVEQYQRWADTRIWDSKKVLDLYRTLTKGTTDDPKRTNGLSDRLYAQYLDEIQERGKNIFSVVSALTHYSSHDDERFGLTKRGDDVTLLKREEQVSTWLNSKVFADYLQAA
jgi:hypothetical protein